MTSQSYAVDVHVVPLPPWVWLATAATVAIAALVTGLIVWRTTRRKGPPPLPRP